MKNYKLNSHSCRVIMKNVGDIIFGNGISICKLINIRWYYCCNFNQQQL